MPPCVREAGWWRLWGRLRSDAPSLVEILLLRVPSFLPTQTLKTMKIPNDYGYFDTRQGCYVLNRPPPRKWLNVHYNACGENEVYAEVSNIGDGPVTVRDNDGCSCQVVGYDCKYIYLRDDETGVVFNPGGDPVPTPVKNLCTRYFASRTETQCTCRGLRVTHRTFVPRTEICEVHTVTVKNTSARPRTLSVFGYAMFQLTGCGPKGQWVGKDNSSEILPELGGVFVRNRDRAVPNGRFNGYLVTLNRDAFVGAVGYRDFFTRSAYSLAAPRCLDRNWNCDNRGYRGPDCAGAVQVRLVIPAKGEARVDFLLGQAANPQEIASLLARTSPESLDAACREQDQIESKRADAFTIDTGFGLQDAVINHFVKKQMVSYLINKSGFRDNLQNDLGVSLFEYPLVRANLLRALASQYPNGSVPHGFRPFNLHQYSDKPAWMLHCVPWVIQESGDFSLLDEVVGYYESPLRETVWQHMLRSMRFLVKDTGANGLCDQHFADWNDGLEPSEETGARESVMVTQQLCLGLLELAELARRRGESEVEEECRGWHAEFTRRLNSVAWDGEWYRRTLTESGYILGSAQNPEGRIFLNTQSWAILSQTAPAERARQCMDAVDRLVETPFGFAICEPPFTRFDQRIGKFSASRPFYAENGGCYNHAAGFKTVADCMLGRAEQAWRTVRKVMPDSPWNPVANSWMEPFSFTNCFSRTPEWPGMSMYAWRTGTAAWFTVALVEWILGARRHYDGLLIDPCLSREIPRARLRRTFRDTVFMIEIDNSSGRGRGVRELRVDGRLVTERILPATGGRHRVQVVL